MSPLVKIKDVKTILTQPGHARLVIVKVETSEQFANASAWLSYNAISGVDQALWDIKGKRARMPLYQLLGGKVREAAAVYVHADGRDPQEVEANARHHIEQGFRYVRVQMGGYGGQASGLHRPKNAPEGNYFDPRDYSRNMLKMIAHVRSRLGEQQVLEAKYLQAAGLSKESIS